MVLVLVLALVTRAHGFVFDCVGIVVFDADVSLVALLSYLFMQMYLWLQFCPIYDWLWRGDC